MSNRSTGDGAGRYEIRVKGQLDPRWADWFEGLTVTPWIEEKNFARSCVVEIIAPAEPPQLPIGQPEVEQPGQLPGSGHSLTIGRLGVRRGHPEVDASVIPGRTHEGPAADDTHRADAVAWCCAGDRPATAPEELSWDRPRPTT